jgi:predicted DNA-binding transcriptional regulator AlpA
MKHAKQPEATAQSEAKRHHAPRPIEVPAGKQMRSAAHVCARFDISRPTLWRWIKSGRFPAPTKMGSLTKWSDATLDEAQANLAVGAGR